MDAHETGLSSYFNPHRQIQPSTIAPPQPSATETTTASSAAAASPASNGVLLPNYGDTVAPADGSSTAVLYPQSMAGKAPTPPPPLEAVKKKRGRPRKYASPEAAAAAKRAASTGLSSPPASSKKQMTGSGSHFSPSSKKAQLSSDANTAQCFMPHVINVNPGEDVAQKIRVFGQQSSKELCVLSASGSVCNASLAQQAAAGGSVTYEGRFEIVSLSGSFVHTAHGERTGGLSTCLAAQDGQIVGGGITGPVVAAGPVEVIVATFQLESMKDVHTDNKGESMNTTLTSHTSTPVSAVGGYRPVFEPPTGFSSFAAGMTDHQNMGTNPFLMQQQGMHMGSSHPTDWRLGLESGSSFNFSFAGQTGHEANGTSGNGNYEHLPD